MTKQTEGRRHYSQLPHSSTVVTYGLMLIGAGIMLKIAKELLRHTIHKKEEQNG